MSRIIPSTLRMASEPLTSREIALQLLVERTLDKSDLRLLSNLAAMQAALERGGISLGDNEKRPEIRGPVDGTR